MTQPEQFRESAAQSPRQPGVAQLQSIGTKALLLVTPEMTTPTILPLTGWGLQIERSPGGLEKLLVHATVFTNRPQPITVIKTVALYPGGVSFTDLREQLYPPTTSSRTEAINRLHDQLQVIGNIFADNKLDDYWQNSILDDVRIIKLVGALPTEPPVPDAN